MTDQYLNSTPKGCQTCLFKRPRRSLRRWIIDLLWT